MVAEADVLEEGARVVDDGVDTLNDFGVSIPLSGMVPESKDMSQEAERVSGSQNMMKTGMMDLKR